MQKIDSLDTQINKNNQQAHNETDNKVAEKLDSLHSVLNERACEYEKIEQIIKTHACNNKIFTRNSIGGSGTNFAEWSFSLNNSINNQTNADSNGDLYQLLHSLESNSWSAFDHITKIVNKIADAIKIDNSDRDTIRSPLTESIQLDFLNKIPEQFMQLNDKYDRLMEILAEKALSSYNTSSFLSQTNGAENPPVSQVDQHIITSSPEPIGQRIETDINQ